MNERMLELYRRAQVPDTAIDPSNNMPYETTRFSADKFAELIVKECAELNKKQSYELMGVITDVQEGDGFDEVCLNTVKRVAEHLNTGVKEHFGVEE